MLELVDDRDQVLGALDNAETVVGRSPKADLTLADYGVSRFHAKFLRRGDDVFVKDLESRNGTKVNDQPIGDREVALKSGDRITLGNLILTFRVGGAAAVSEGAELDDDGELSEAGGTIIRDQAEIERLLAGAIAAPAAADIEKSNKILRMLTQVAKALIEEDTLDGILVKVMDLVFENIPGERGVLGLFDGDRLDFRVVRYRKERADGEKITIPRAITNKVRKDRVSILTMDAQQDKRFDASHSILLLGIRSAMCVPLWDRELVIGIIYLDEDIRAGTFNTEDLDLLSALANYAAVAIERTRLNQKIQEEQATREKLSRYHSPGVVERIISGGGAADSLEMQEHDVTVCFADIVGFTTMSETLKPAEVGQVINEFFTELTECVFRHEGTLDKYIGDCIMAVWGAPIAQPDHAIRCVRATLEMLSTLDRLNAERGESGPKLQLRIGINSGPVVAGDIGSPKRKDYSVLGDTVNLAARLESSVSKPGWVVIGQSTHAAVKDEIECESLGNFHVKGKKIDVAAYRVFSLKTGSTLESAEPI